MLTTERLVEIDELLRRHAVSAYSLREAARDLRAEVTRLRKWQGYNACTTGDCPHESTGNCIESLGASLDALAADNDKLEAEVERLRKELAEANVVREAFARQRTRVIGTAEYSAGYMYAWQSLDAWCATLKLDPDSQTNGERDGEENANP